MKILLWGGTATLLVVGVYIYLTPTLALFNKGKVTSNIEYSRVDEPVMVAPILGLPVASHLSTPEIVKGVYLSAWGAGDTKLRNSVIDLIKETELNAVVIDVKDYTGQLSFHLDPIASTTEKYAPIYAVPNQSAKIKDIRGLIDTLHKENIYVIARIAVFQDPFMSKYKTEIAIKNKSREGVGGVWKDKKGLTWVNASNMEYWQYIEALSKYSHDIGFDEINLDYIRFPTDGDMSQMELGLASTTKYEIINSFYEYMGDALYDYTPVSADLFGLTTIEVGDMGIGQRIESGLRNFDFVAPMIYPSHYGIGFKGIKVPDSSPYETIRATMLGAKEKVSQLATDTDQTDEYYWSKMRPWIQDFSLHHNYGVTEVQAQIRALHELGIDSYLIWNASNRYTKGVKY